MSAWFNSNWIPALTRSSWYTPFYALPIKPACDKNVKGINIKKLLILNLLLLKDVILLKETKFSELAHEQIDEIKQLEEKLGVTLIAYDNFPTESNTPYGNNPVVINPS